MGSRALQQSNALINQAISIDRLFDAAFHAPIVVYQRESLYGWRPLHNEGPRRTKLRKNPPRRHRSFSPDSPPGIQVHETAERFIIEVELPQIKADSLYIEISGDLLIIRGEREMKNLSDPSDQKQGRGGPMVHRYIQLPVITRPGEVHARLEGNTVRVKIQKRPKAA